MATAGHEIQEKYENSLYRKNYYNLVSHIEEKMILKMIASQKDLAVLMNGQLFLWVVVNLWKSCIYQDFKEL